MESIQRQSHFPLKPTRKDIAWSPPVSKKNHTLSTPVQKGFCGFGAAPPPIRKHAHHRLKRPDDEDKVLKDAERLVRVMLGNDDEKLTSDSIQKVLEKHTASQTKSRYKTLLAKPWRTTPKKWEPNGRHQEESSESNVFERIENFEMKNPQSFRLRRSSTSDVDTGSVFTRAKSMYNENFGVDESEGGKLKAELAEAAIELKAQKTRISFLKEQIALLQTSSSNDLNMSFLSDGGNELHDQIERLQHRLQEAEAARDHAKSKSDEYSAKLSEMETRLRRAESDGRQNQLARLEEELTYVKAKYSDETQKLKQDSDSVRMEKEVAEANVKILEKHLSDAQQVIQDNEAELKIRNELTHERFIKFETMLDEADAEMRKVKEQLAETEVENMNLKLRLEDMERKSREPSNIISNDGDEKQMQIDELMKSLAIAEARLIEARDDGEQERRGLERRIEDMKGMLATSEQKATKAENAIAQVNRENDELRRMIDTLQDQNSKSTDDSSHSTEVEKLRNIISSLEEKLANTETQSRNTAELNSIESLYATQELKNAKDMLQCREDELESCQAELSTMSAELRETEQKLKHLEAQRNDVKDEFEGKLLESERKVQDLEKEIEELKSLNAELVDVNLHNANEKLQELGGQIASLKKSRDEAANRAFKSEALVVELNQKLADANSMSRDAATQLENFEAAKSQELEILKDELRESENTIACLMEDLDLLKPLAIDLEEAEKDLAETAAALKQCKNNMADMKTKHKDEVDALKLSLEESEQHVVQLNDELKLLLPLASELEQVKNELSEAKARSNVAEGDPNGDMRVSHHKLEHDAAVLRQQLEAKNDALRLAEQRASALTVAHSAEKERLAARYMESENENAHLSDELDDVRKKLSIAESLLDAAENRASALAAEMKPLKEKVESINASHMHLEAVDNLEQILEQKEKEIEALQKQVEIQDHQITSCRALVQDLEEERNYSRARITELSGLLDGAGEPEKLLREKTGQVAKLTAERDTLLQKLKVVEAMATTLEHDNEQKKKLVQELMKTSSDDDSATVFIEKLQSEHERTLQRCSDLSLQLAESQFKIDELTEKLRKLKKPKGPPPVKNNPKVMRRSNSFNSATTPSRNQSGRASIKAMFAHGVDRLLSGDDSATEQSEISRSVHGIMTGSPLKAFRRSGSMDNQSER